MSVRGKARIFRFSDEQYTSMSGYFTKYDQDHDGELNFTELRNLVREVGHYQDGSDLDPNTQTLMKKLNASGSGSLTFNEFLKGYERMLASAEGDESLASLDILHVTAPVSAKPTGDKGTAAVKEAADKVAAAKAAAEKAAQEEADRKAATEKEAAEKKATADKEAADKARDESNRKAATDKEAADKAARDEANRRAAAEKAADEKKKATTPAKKVSVTLEWNYGGSQVLVGGTFNNWQLVPMNHKEGTQWIYVVHDQEPNTELLYKFHVDGQWAENREKHLDENERIEGRVVVNNKITTPSS